MLDLIGGGRHRIAAIFGRASLAEVPFPDGSLFRNINTMSDFEATRRESSAGQSAFPGQPALVAIAGKSHAGITALMDVVVPELVKLGLRVVAEEHDRTAARRVELLRAGAGRAESLCGLGEPMALVTDAELAHEYSFGLGDAAGLARSLAVRLGSLREY